MRVGIIALLHESNTFISQPTTLEHFRHNLLLTGEPIRQQLGDTHHEVSGFFDGLKWERIEAVPIFAARAIPYGTIASDAFAQLLASMLAALQAAGPCDGYLVAPHGATVSQLHRDADGHWLTAVRQQVGPGVPIIGTLDAHANLSPAMVTATDALIAYRTNPHLDQRQRGQEAARLMAATLRRQVRPTQAAAFPPLVINIERQLTSEPQLVPLYRQADAMLQRPGVLANSILLGFPYADVPSMGAATLVVTDDDRELAATLARELADSLWQRREDFVGQMIDADEAVAQAAEQPGPTCLLDMGDNIGGGSPGDSTHLGHALRRQGANAFLCLCDPESAAQAAAAGSGAELSMRLGGKSGPLHGGPLEGTFEVLGLFDGKFVETEVRHGGFTHCDQGLTALVRDAGGLTVMLTSHRMPPFSLQQLLSCGVDPARFQMLVAKGVNAPVAAYREVCPHFIRVNTPGCTTADLAQLDFRFRRRPLFPWEPQAAFAE